MADGKRVGGMSICSYCGSSHMLVGVVTEDKICGSCGRLQEQCHNCLAKTVEIERLRTELARADQLILAAGMDTARLAKVVGNE